MKVIASLREVALKPKAKADDEAIQSLLLSGLPRPLCGLAMTAIIVSLSFSLTACGNKGALKSPSQIAAEQARQARKDAKQTQQQPVATPPAAAPVSPPVSGSQ